MNNQTNVEDSSYLIIIKYQIRRNNILYDMQV